LISKGFPHTCHCILDFINKVQLKQCRTHNNYDECIRHNKRFSNRNTGETEEQHDTRMQDEKDKQQFQRR